MTWKAVLAFILAVASPLPAGAQESDPAAGPPVPAPPPTKRESDGFSITPFGRIQLDIGNVDAPSGVTDPGLGTRDEVRRARIGVEGRISGPVTYKAEIDLAEGNVEFIDVFLTYKAKRAAFSLGQHNSFQSLEELTSSRFISFMERAAFTDAFNFERRVGLSGSYVKGDLALNAGLFHDNIHDLSVEGERSDALSIDGRIVYSPKRGGSQLHFGASAHHRDNGDTDATRYRQRPMVHTSDTRFIGTPALQVRSETNYGVEAALIRGPFHATGELHWLDADTEAQGSPGFFGGYAEAGYYLTGETRGYKSGRWDRTKVLRPLHKGGPGAFQINLRYDHLDLSSGTVVGGRQRGYQASLIWIPHDRVRFLLNYGRLDFNDAVIAAADERRDYAVDVLGARAQWDF